MSTPDAHVAELVRLAEHYEKAVKHFERNRLTPQPTLITDLYQRRAAAIRWLLAETAHGVDPNEIVT